MSKTKDKPRGLISQPTQALALTEEARQVAEIQSRLTIAKRMPRDEVKALEKIRTSCQRLRLAETAEYEYPRGNEVITGPSIRLIETCARCWGNIDYGFRELSQGDGESTVEAFAWDLETNCREVRSFIVPHWRDTKSGGYALKDRRDIREMIANQAQRNVRSCLEHVVPRDIWEEAVQECRRTVKAEVATDDQGKIDSDTLQSMIAAFEQFDVTKDQIQKRFGRRIDELTPANYLAMKRIWCSLNDGMTVSSDWFDDPKAVSAEDVLARANEQGDSPDDAEPTKEQINATSKFASRLAKITTQDSLTKVSNEIGEASTKHLITESEFRTLCDLVDKVQDKINDNAN